MIGVGYDVDTSLFCSSFESVDLRSTRKTLQFSSNAIEMSDGVSIGIFIEQSDRSAHMKLSSLPLSATQAFILKW